VHLTTWIQGLQRNNEDVKYVGRHITNRWPLS
jgi:hypothetical protein